MKAILFLVIVLCSGACAGKMQPIKALQEWGNRSAVNFEELSGQAFACQPLSREESRLAAAILDSLWRDAVRTKYATDWQDGWVNYDTLRMKLGGRIYGEQPADGRSLFISMHGGGSVPAKVNDQQWHNQIFLYQPEEGVYIAPRAPWDDWDMWFKPGMDELLERLIQTAVVVGNVSPDKVYLLGYSAGGDGVWRMASRMADRWAAASMMAGHPGNTSQVNLRNLPYMIWVGGKDSAYDRNRLGAERGHMMDSLQQADPAGYIHETHILKDKGHWMDRADTAAIAWMAQYHRNPWPQRVVWRQEEVVSPSFYWLTAPADELQSGRTVIAEYKDNIIEILRCDYTRLLLRLNDSMVDLDRPVVVRYQGRILFEGKPIRTIATLCRTLNERSDLRYMFPAEVEAKLDKADG